MTLCKAEKGPLRKLKDPLQGWKMPLRKLNDPLQGWKSPLRNLNDSLRGWKRALEEPQRLFARLENALEEAQRPVSETRLDRTRDRTRRTRLLCRRVTDCFAFSDRAAQLGFDYYVPQARIYLYI
jgi:hypothetical protein